MQKAYRSLKDSLVWQVPVFRYCKGERPRRHKTEGRG